MPITKAQPRTNAARETALRIAFGKNAAAGAATIFTDATIARLNTHYPLYNDAFKLVQLKKGLGNGAVEAKNIAKDDCYLYVRHFLIGIMMAVERKEYPLSALAMYGLATENPKLPAMEKEQQIIQAAQNCITGEAARIAAGGTPLPMPTIAQVTGKKNAFQNAITARDNADYELNIAQEALAALNAEANRIIKKAWAEAETKYNEEAIESRRDKCRPWGVVYISDTRYTISLQAFVIKNNQAVPHTEAILTLPGTGDSKKANKNGIIKFKSGYTGSGTLSLEAPQCVTQQFTRNFGHADIDLGAITMAAE